jgi:hypothetical protein
MKPPSENQPQEVLAGLVGELHVPSAYAASIHKSLWVEPISGMAFPSAEDEVNLGTAAPQNAVH